MHILQILQPKINCCNYVLAPFRTIHLGACECLAWFLGCYTLCSWHVSLLVILYQTTPRCHDLSASDLYSGLFHVLSSTSNVWLYYYKLSNKVVLNWFYTYATHVNYMNKWICIDVKHKHLYVMWFMQYVSFSKIVSIFHHIFCIIHERMLFHVEHIVCHIMPNRLIWHF